MNIQDLLEEIREGLPAPSWSKAVRCAREGQVTLVNKAGTTASLDVFMGRPLPFRVALNLEDEDWECTCPSPDDACTHVAAALLALKHASFTKSPQNQDEGLLKPYLSYRFTRQAKRWTLEAFEVIPDRTPKARVILPGASPSLVMSPADDTLLRLIHGGLWRTRPKALLEALRFCRDVRVTGRPVQVAVEPLQPVLKLSPHPRGLLARIRFHEKIHDRILERPGLGVVGDPPTLRPILSGGLPPQQEELYLKGRIVPHDDVGAFIQDKCRILRKSIAIDMSEIESIQRESSPPYNRLVLKQMGQTLEVHASITYGHPPRAYVIGDKLHRVSETIPAPLRRLDLEAELRARLAKECGMNPGTSLRLRGVEACRFVSTVLLRFTGRIEGNDVKEVFQIHPQALEPYWREGSPGELPVLAFRLPALGGEGTDGQDIQVDMRTLVEAYRSGQSLLAAPSGGFVKLPLDWLDRFGDLLVALYEAPAAVKPFVMRSLLDAASTEDALGMASESIRAAIRARSEIAPADVPESVRARLRPYQRHGFRWLNHLEREGLGGILADDMGLGKTLQALTLIAKDMGSDRRTLVVVPTSVLVSWQTDAARFVPSLRLHLYHGGGRNLRDAADADVVLTTYGILRRDIDRLETQTWHRIILDEAQAIKNPASQVARAARRLRARHRHALSGTPLENRLEELWSILEFVNPGLLGSRQRFEEEHRDAGAGEDRAMRRLRIRVAPFILRRLKREVAGDLPPRIERTVRATLSTGERELYHTLLNAGRSQVHALLKEAGAKKNRIQILQVILRLRQACAHPGLIPGAPLNLTRTSSKLSLLLNELDIILSEGHRALVFSQWTALLDRVEPLLREAGFAWLRLDGSTRDRGKIVSLFQKEDGPPILLISLKAGGTGLNLTAADYVYHLDPWWNPAVEDQASDRAHRIGQTRPVVVNRIIAEDTIEEKLLALQERKRALAEAALGGGDEWLATLEDEDIEALLT